MSVLQLALSLAGSTHTGIRQDTYRVTALRLATYRSKESQCKSLVSPYNGSSHILFLKKDTLAFILAVCSGYLGGLDASLPAINHVSNHTTILPPYHFPHA